MARLLLQHIRSSFKVIFILAAVVAKGQQSTPFIIGAVGFNSSAAPVYSQSVVFDMKDCIQVSNGISILLNKKKGIFENDCLVKNPNALMGLVIEEAKIFPNPARDYIYFNYQGAARSVSASVKLNLFTMEGQWIRQLTMPKMGSLNPFRIDVGYLPNGQYLLAVMSVNQPNKIFKFQILK